MASLRILWLLYSKCQRNWQYLLLPFA